MEELSRLVQNYHPNKHTIDYLRKVPLVIIAGVSGAGKNTTIQELLKTNKFQYIISYTTRKPRINNGIKEKNGLNYHFIDNAQAYEMLKNKAFIEGAITHENFYGTALRQFQEAFKKSLIPISDIDIQGTDFYHQIGAIKEAFFLLPPNLKVLIDRINVRYSNNLDYLDFKNRIKTSIQELDSFKKQNYFIPIINNNKEEASKAILEYLFEDKKPLDIQNTRKTINKLEVDLKNYYKTL